MPNFPSFDYFYERLLEFYKTYTLKGLSEATGIPITTFSSIKQRKSMSALKKKCMELNIYPEIFGDAEITYDLQLGRRFYSDEEIEQMQKEQEADYINYLKLQNKKIEKIPKSIINELENLFNILINDDETTIKKITYQIEDFLIDLKKQNRK